jgi:protein-S-isoprenylcysteine O-methyltransferase Ste14
MTLNPLLVFPFLACFLSFGWGIKNFFVRPARVGRRLRLVAPIGLVFVAASLTELLIGPRVSVGRAVIALCLYVLSFTLFWWAITANRLRPLAACFSEARLSHITQSGPYRFIRHPFYTSYMLAVIAGLATGASVVTAPPAVILLGMYISAARGEEILFAGSELAEAYADYKDRTGMFIPSVRVMFFVSSYRRKKR